MHLQEPGFRNSNLCGRKRKKEVWRRSQRDCQDCRDAAGDIMQDTKAGNGVTLPVEPVYEGGICLTLICTIKELLIFT